MQRVVILGGQGQFGSEAARQLQQRGIQTLIGSRRPGSDLQIDANNAEMVQAALQAGDIVLDSAGPFQNRNAVLVDQAIAQGFDLVDLNDSLAYAQLLGTRREQAEQAGVRIMSSSSSVSVLAALAVQKSGIARPIRISSFLVPASRHTAHLGSARSLIASLGRPITFWNEGRLEQSPGWRNCRTFPMPPPLGVVTGWQFESADAHYLPQIWPSLEHVSMYIDTNTKGMNQLLRMASRSSFTRWILSSGARPGSWLARRFGATASGLGYEISGREGEPARLALVATDRGYRSAVAPAVLAIERLVKGDPIHAGIVLPHEHLASESLHAYLAEMGLHLRSIAE